MRRWRLQRRPAGLPGAQQPLRPALAVRLARRRTPPLRAGPLRVGRATGLPVGRLRVSHRPRRHTDRRTDYLPRRFMGEYLAWFYETLVAAAPPNMEVVRHRRGPSTSSARRLGGSGCVLDERDGDERRPRRAHLRPHLQRGAGPGHRVMAAPAALPGRLLRKLASPAGAPMAIGGMGLVAFDLLAALTVGRGGSFDDSGMRKRYVPSGREPEIYLYSRSGVPYCAKSAHGIDPTGDYQPVVCTPGGLGRREPRWRAPGRSAKPTSGRPPASALRRDAGPVLHPRAPAWRAAPTPRRRPAALVRRLAGRALPRRSSPPGRRPRSVRSRGPALRRRRLRPLVGQGLRALRLRDGRARSRRGARAGWQPGEGGAGGAAHPA